jgi:teichuronic acid exporter
MDLKTRTLNSTVWYAGTRLWTQALSWAVTLVLARLLTPADYGLFAMAQTCSFTFELLQEFGLGAAIVQRQHLTREQLNAIFWIVCGTSLSVATVACLSAGLAARFYGEPRLTQLIQLLSLTFLLDAFGMVPYNLLTKELDFRRRSLAAAWGVVASAGVSVGLAYCGSGFWALVAGQLARAVVRNIMVSVFCGWHPGCTISFLDMGKIIRFGLHVAGAGGIATLSTITTRALIGRFLGSYELGLYSMSTTMGLDNPMHRLVTSVVNQLSLPVFSTLQQDDEQLRWYFLKITKYLAVIAWPAQIGMALVAHDLVSVLLSDTWQPIVRLVQAFAVGGVFYIVSLPTAPSLTARGKAHQVLRFSCLSLMGTIAACFLGLPFGLNGIATAWLVLYPLCRAYLVVLSLREIRLSLRQYLQNLCSPILATVAMTLVLLTMHGLLLAEAQPLARLMLDLGAGGVTYAMVILLIDRRFGTEVKKMVRGLMPGSRRDKQGHDTLHKAPMG